MKKLFSALIPILPFARDAFASDFDSDKYAKDFLVQISHETLNSKYEKAIHHTLERICSFIMMNIPINNSHAKAKEIMKS
jgi:hypothetical protein